MVALAKGQRLNQFKYADRAIVRANPFGNMRYLDSQNGNDGNDGDSPLHPVKTLARALALMDAGDTLVLDPGGSETVTAAVAIALARVRIVCPVLNPEQGFTISGAGTLNLLNPTAADITIEGVKFAHTGATSDQAGILAAAGADRLHVKNCIFDDSAIVTNFTGAGIELTDACNGVRIEGCRFKDCQFGVLSIVATGIVQAGLEVRENEFWIGQAAAFGIATALSGTGALRGLVAMRNKFMELNGSGAAATAAWDGTDGANATQGPIKLEAAADQYLIAENVAYTALSTSFDKINAINAGAAGSLVQNKTAVGGDVEDNVTTINTNVSTLIDQLAGATGIASFPAAAAPANSVSIAEVIRAIYDRQLGDGTNSNANSRLGKKVVKAAANLPATTTQDIFVVSGGRVLVTLLTGEVTTVVQNQTCNLKVTHDATAGGDVDLASNLDIDNFAAGRLLLVEGDGTALVSNGGSILSGIGSAGFVVSEGEIHIETGATNTGATSWELWYIPLDDGAAVASA